MTLIELQNILGERVELTQRIDAEDASFRIENEKSDMIARLAKQMINNADVILRTDKLNAEGKLSDASILRVVGHGGGEE